MGDVVSELTAEDFVARRAAQRTARKHADLVALAAARTAAHGFALLERSRARQARAMKPWLLPVGALVRVSYLHAPTARQQLKSQLVRAMSPSYTQEVYRITARRLAPRSTRVVLYDAVCVDDVAEGDQSAAAVGNYRVQLPLELTDVDRRHLMPASTSGPPSTARAFAGMWLAGRLSPLPPPADEASSSYVGDTEDDGA
jgi:hypothetical protein